MKRFVLVYPNIVKKGIYGQIVKGVAVPPQGICQLAAVLKKAGFSVKLIDALVEDMPVSAIIDRCVEFNPDYLGISATTMQITDSSRIAKGIKERIQNIKVVVGGPHISAVPDETMERFQDFDIGFIGEAENTILEFADVQLNKRPLDEVKGIIFRKNGNLLKTERREFIKDLDTLPFPAWELLPDLRTHYHQSVARIDELPATSVSTSRGCPFKCIFCARNVYGSSFRAHSADYVIRMIKHLINIYGLRSISFEDENFFVNKERLKKICNALIEKKYPLSWSCVGRVDLVNYEDLRLMKKAGCTSISYGIESGSQRILDILGKRLKKEAIESGIKDTVRSGIRARGYFIIGHPTEDRDTIKETYLLIKNVPFSEIQISFMTPFPGTELYTTAKEYGGFNNDWEELNIWTPNFIPKGLTRDDLITEQKSIMRKFYFRPHIILAYLVRMFSSGYFFKYIKDGFTIFRLLTKKRFD